MEALSCWTCPHQHGVVLMFLMTLGSGSACEAPSSPKCFRRKTEEESEYFCEWSLNTTQSSVDSSIHFNKTKVSSSRMTCETKRAGPSLETTCSLKKEDIKVLQGAALVWVEARLGSTTCRSAKRTVVLRHTVKYKAPGDVSFFWFKNNLNLKWTAAEKLPASAEVRFTRDGIQSEPWRQNTTNTCRTSLMCHVVVPNLLQDSVYQVQVRHRSAGAKNPLWSPWSEALTVPAELQHKPEVTMTTRLLNGTREVTLTWKPVSRAAESDLRFILTDSQSALGCPCKARNVTTRGRSHLTTFVSLSALSLQLTANNSASSSPPADLRLPAHRAEPTQVCGNSVPDPPDEKLQSRTCRQWHEIQDGGSSSPDTVITLTAKTPAKERKRRTKSLRDYVRYLYSEHRCVDGSKPQTLQTCLFYKRQGAPLREPQDLAASGETLTSADLSWSQIPPAAQRGFLTHLVLCSVRLGPQDHVKASECRNISASLTSHRLEDLTPGTKYNVSLVGVTGAGGGPEATVSINTLPEKTWNVWWSLGLLSLFFLLTTMCTCILKRISNKIFRPVPKPVFPDFILNPPDSQEFLEGKEELDELTLHQSVPEHPEELLLLTGEEDEGEKDRLDMSDEESHSSEDLKSSRGDETDLEQVDNEIAMLIYRNGLVFDLKTDES